MGIGEIESYDGCFIDIDGVGVNEIVIFVFEGVVIVDDIDGEVKIY